MVTPSGETVRRVSHPGEMIVAEERRLPEMNAWKRAARPRWHRPAEIAIHVLAGTAIAAIVLILLFVGRETLPLFSSEEVRAEVTLASGEVITDELAIADAHPLGARPFERKQYIGKFTELAEGIATTAEQERFLAAAEGLAGLAGSELRGLNIVVEPAVLDQAPATPNGIFR